MPMLASEIELKLYDDQKLERELIQRDSFLLEYSKERKRRVKKNEDSLVWQDLEKIIDEIERKRKQSLEEQLEREKELEEAERKLKEAIEKEKAEQLRQEEEEQAELERREQLKRMSRFEQWEEDKLKQLEPKPDLWDSYDFSEAVSGLGKLNVVTPVSRGAEVDNSDDDLMLSYRVKRRKVSFEGTSRRVLKCINKTLDTYKDDYWEPE